VSELAIGDRITNGVTTYTIRELQRRYQQDGALVVISNPGPGDGRAPRWVTLSGMRKVEAAS
jgi:hypothetical protein